MPNYTVQPSQYSAIQQQIFNIGSAVTWQVGSDTESFKGFKLGEVPTSDELPGGAASGTLGINGGAAQWPFFAVRQGSIQGFAIGAELQSGDDTGMRGMDMVEPVWDFDVYALFPYTVDQPNYDQAANALVALTVAYLDNFQLNGTCQVSNPHSWALVYINMTGNDLTAAKLKIRTYEALYKSYG